ncbi:MAG: hypothetical protein ACRC8S_16495 [Fimbriiglobus sp.]
MDRFTRSLLCMAAFGLLLVAVAPLEAQQPTNPPTPSSASDLRNPQEQNADMFRKFQRELLFLAQKLENSDKPEDKERAKVIFSALDVAKREKVDAQFQKMVAGFGTAGGNLQQLDSIAGQDKQLQKALQDILTILMTDDSATQLRTERERLEKILAEAKEVLRSQKTIRAMTDVKRVDADRIAKDQQSVTERTKDLAKKLAGDTKTGNEQKNGKPGEEAIPKSEPKPTEPKDGEQAGDMKPDTQESKSDPKSASDPMKPGAESPQGKPSEKKNSEKAGESKASGEPKSGEPKEPKAGEPKSGEPKSSEPKAGEPKAGEPKSGEPKAGEPKAGEPKAGEPKAGEPKAGEPKEPKPGDSKGQSQGKGQDKPSDDAQAGKPKGIEAKPMQDSQQANAKGPGQQSPPPPPGGDQQPQNPGQQSAQQQQQQPGRKQIQEAIPKQQASQKDLEKTDREKAAKNQEKAIEDLAKAIQELEKRIKQLREEETLKLLATLEARCGKMLSMQIEVYEATKVIDGILVKNGGNRTNVEVQKSQQQADRELEIIAEADKTLKILESEGSAVAFAKVLEEVRVDMIAVQRRLNDTYVGKDTQQIEENIISMLKEMVEALKKAQQEQQQQQQQQQQPGQPPKPQDRNLLEAISELKLIRALQLQVNDRTKGNAQQYKGEQASDPIIKNELRQLAERQAKIQDMLQKIASGKNK